MSKQVQTLGYDKENHIFRFFNPQEMMKRYSLCDLKEVTIEESKRIQIDILNYIREICEKNGLKYYLAYGTLLGAVREHYDYIIVDTPPIGSIIDAAIVAKQCDGAVLVFESELVSSKEAARVKEQLLMTGCRLIGAVLNKVDVKKNKYYHRYDYYYHGYQEKKEVTKKNKEK